MAQVLQYTFRLFGPNRGKTLKFGAHVFLNGICKMYGRPEDMGHVMKVLGYHAAYAMGTREYEAALEAEGGEGNGLSDPQADAESRQADSVSSDHQSDGEGPSSEEEDDEFEHASASAGSEVVRSNGDGRSDAGIPKFEESASLKEPEEPVGSANPVLAKAVMKLDPEDDDHWTKAGLPALVAVEDALGKAGATRKDVDAAIPGWNREKAYERLAAEL